MGLVRDKEKKVSMRWVWYGMVWYGYGMGWSGMAWHGMVGSGE